MRILFLLPAWLLLQASGSFAQNRTRDFSLTPPERKISNSLYNHITLIDARSDTTNMGIVQLGAFNAKARVVPDTPFAVQLNNMMLAITDATALNGELLLYLRQLSFAEVTGAFSEKGYYYFSADLYAAADNSFQKIGAMDTVVLVKSWDVTKAIFRHGSETLTGFIQDHLLRAPSGQIKYSLADVHRMDDIEKESIPLYRTASYTDGAYLTRETFFAQTPDRQVTGQIKKGTLESVKTIEADGKPAKLKAKDAYAVVLNGVPFVATDYGYYPLRKQGNDFYFTGKAKVTANAGDVIAASVFFGVIGGLLASNASSTFEMKIDYRNGGFVRIREIEEPTQTN